MSGNASLFTPIRPLLSAPILAAVLGAQAHAAPPASCDVPPPVRVVEYVIATDTVPLVDGYSEDQMIFAAAVAAEAWNEQTNGTYLVYAGEYVGDQICTQRQIDCKAGTDPTCHAAWIYQNACPETTVQIDCSQIPDDGLLIGAQARTGWGEKRSICSGEERVTFNTLGDAATQFNLVDRLWSTGLPGAAENDLLFTLTHELGHVVGLGDHYNNSGTIMTGVPALGADLHDLYAWDRGCVSAGGHRSLDGYRRYVSGGNLGSEWMFTAGWQLTNGAPGVTRGNGFPQWASVANADAEVFMHEGLSDFTNADDVWWTHNSWSTAAAQSPRLIRFRGQSAYTSEVLDIDYVVYSSEEDYDAPGTHNGRHQMRYVRSDDAFASSLDRGYLATCTNMLDWDTCSSSEMVYSAKPLTLAYNDAHDVSVAAWVNQGDDISNMTNRHEIAVAVGLANSSTLGERQWLGVHSAVTPAMACKDDPSSSRDCFVAYVDLDDADGRIEIERFDLSRNDGQYRFDLSNRTHVENPSGLTSVRTASSMTAWYHSDRYYLAIKSLEPGMPVRVFRSSWNGGSFSEVSGDFGTTVAGPEAVSHWQGSNALTTFRAP